MKLKDLFDRLPNGALTPRQPFKLGGVFMGKGSKMGGNVTLNGINLTANAECEIEFHMDGEIIVIDHVKK